MKVNALNLLFLSILFSCSSFSLKAQLDPHQAARVGDWPSLASYLAQGQAIDTANDFGHTPLILAVYYGQTELVEKLLENGAKPDHQDQSGNTALMGACFKGELNLAKRLLEHGADVNVLNDNGASALFFVVSFGHKDLFELLLDSGARTDFVDALGHTVLHYAKVQGQTAMAQRLEQKKALEKHSED